jgi:hypothetical protein
MPNRTKKSEGIEAAQALFDHVRAKAAVAAATAGNCMGKWLLREGCARRGHGSRDLAVPIDGRYGNASRSRWAFAQGMAEGLRAQGIRAYADRLE